MKNYFKKFCLMFVMVFTVISVGLIQNGTMASAATKYDAKTLDTGIYWFGKGNVSQKFVSGESNKYFDSSKPTVIYIHGWQKDKTEKLYREIFNPSHNDSSYGADVDTVNYWVDKGWNIGIFYWNQLSDESEVKDAEAKIWTTSGSKGMRWRKVDGSYNSINVPTVSAAQLFVDDYVKAMKNFSGSEIRLAGHSLGSQMVINGGMLISNLVDSGTISSNILPDRICLLDPFWSKGEKSYLGNKWTGEVSRNYVTSLKTKGVVFEQYKSSNINDLWIGDSNDGMKQLTAFIDVYPDYTGLINQASKHGASRDLYFYSMGFDAPAEMVNGVDTGNDAGYAPTSTSRILEMMNSKYKWTQNAGKSTNTPADDNFNKTSK
ncbi:cell adhesion domain-containing protein [Clostridium saccharoperbutylacetonicum]